MAPIPFYYQPPRQFMFTFVVFVLVLFLFTRSLKHRKARMADEAKQDRIIVLISTLVLAIAIVIVARTFFGTQKNTLEEPMNPVTSGPPGTSGFENEKQKFKYMTDSQRKREIRQFMRFALQEFRTENFLDLDMAVIDIAIAAVFIAIMLILGTICVPTICRQCNTVTTEIPKVYESVRDHGSYAQHASMRDSPYGDTDKKSDTDSNRSSQKNFKPVVRYPKKTWSNPNADDGTQTSTRLSGQITAAQSASFRSVPTQAATTQTTRSPTSNSKTSKHKHSTHATHVSWPNWDRI